jgi:hypothetical protein
MTHCESITKDCVNAELWEASTLKMSNLEHSRGPNECRMDDKEHVDEDESFKVNNVPVSD